jgi:hypothetical protein
MYEFSSALSQMDLSNFEPLVDAEAPDKSCKVAQQAALSRRCIVQDAIDYWNPPVAQERADTESVEEWTPLNLGMIRELELSWILEGSIIHAPGITDWWVPIDREAIMRFGHSVNSAIPDDPNEAEFPPEPWNEHMAIRT